MLDKDFPMYYFLNMDYFSYLIGIAMGLLIAILLGWKPWK